MSLDVDEPVEDVQNDGTGDYHGASDDYEEPLNSGSSGETADDKSGDATPTEPTGGDEQSVFSDHSRELASSFGLSDEDLNSFGSEDALLAAIRLSDSRNIASVAQQWDQFQQPSGQQVFPQQPLGQQIPQTGGQQVQQTAAGHPNDLQLDWGEDPEDIDPIIRTNIERAFSSMQQQFEQLRQEQQRLQDYEREQSFLRETQQFDATLDELPYDGFGKSENLNQLQLGKRQQLWQTLSHLRAVDAAQGGTGEISQQLIQRAYMASFPQEFTKQQQKLFAQGVRKQSGKRLGGGGRTGTQVEKWDGDPAEDPYLSELFDSYAEQSNR